MFHIFCQTYLAARFTWIYYHLVCSSILYYASSYNFSIYVSVEVVGAAAGIVRDSSCSCQTRDDDRCLAFSRRRTPKSTERGRVMKPVFCIIQEFIKRCIHAHAFEISILTYMQSQRLELSDPLSRRDYIHISILRILYIYTVFSVLSPSRLTSYNYTSVKRKPLFYS